MELAKKIDQTNIKKGVTKKEIEESARKAKKLGFRGLCVRPQWVKIVHQELEGSGVKTVCLVDPPIGDSPHQERIAICQKAKEEGADELDVVASLPDIKHERWQKIKNDLKEICQILPTKVIIGSGYLTDEEIAIVSEIAQDAGAMCVKTATEKDPLEHREIKEKLLHLAIMQKSAPRLLIKASGNIKNFNDARRVLEAGADIIGTSYGEEILRSSQ